MKPKTPPKLNPGDEAKPGTPGTGEDICPDCNGKGKNARGDKCANCGGTGKIVRGIGGA
jgi:RecJ-like exonuclease